MPDEKLPQRIPNNTTSGTPNTKKDGRVENVTDEELDKTHAINALIDGKLLDPERIRSLSDKEVDRYAGYYKALTSETEILSKDIQLQERDGYPSDECVVIVRAGAETTIAPVRVIEYFDQEDLLQAKMQGLTETHDRPQRKDNQAITYKSGRVPMFTGEMTMSSRTVSEEDIAQAKEQATQAGVTCFEIVLPEDSNHISVLKAVNKITEGYIESLRSYLRERIIEAQEVKDTVIDVLRKNKGLEPKLAENNIAKQLWKEFHEKGNMNFVGAYNTLSPALDLKRLSDLRNFGYEPIELPHYVYEALIAVFGPQDSLRQLKEYYNSKILRGAGFDKSAIDPKKKIDIPKDRIFQGCRIAEVGGDFIDGYDQQGAETYFQERHYSLGEFGGIKSGETQITQKTYKQIFPVESDITLSRQVMDANSGIETGFASTMDGARDLLTVFSKITREGGISIHQGGAVPIDKKFLDSISFEHIYTFPTRPDPTYLFLKTKASQ